jgi:hypothetical protein
MNEEEEFAYCSEGVFVKLDILLGEAVAGKYFVPRQSITPLVYVKDSARLEVEEELPPLLRWYIFERSTYSD